MRALTTRPGSPLVTIAAALAVAFLSACGSSSSATTTVRGKKASERPARTYIGDNGCSGGTDVVLNAQTGAPMQSLCGLLATDPSGHPIYKYLGIQYAESPAGQSRWTAPRAPTWREYNATEFGPRCPQGGGADIATADVDEDCLYLNVWTPTITPNGGGTLPVMVFIHGGAFISGSGGSALGTQPGYLNLYDGSQFVATSHGGSTPVVFVTLNYRLGVLGFLAGDTLGLPGNYGIMDQTAALQWVQRNIGLFGGDPSKVMIFGESAGAQSVALHLTMASDQNLFAGAILESNYALGYQTTHSAQLKANSFANKVSCNESTPAATLQCLRNTPLENVLNGQVRGSLSAKDLECFGLQTLIPWQPVIDGQLVTQEPVLASVSKPFIAGSNLTESIPFVAGMPFKTKAEWDVAYPGLMLGIFGAEKAAEILARYELYHSELDSEGKLERVVTDYLWTCFNRNFTSTQYHSGPARWRYFDVHSPSYPIWVNAQGQVSGAVDEACAASTAVCHGNELPFVFGNQVNMQSQIQTFTTDEVTFSSTLQKYWIEFARKGNPNSLATPVNWSVDTDKFLLRLQAPPTGMNIQDDLSLDTTAQCSAFWDKVGYVVTSAFTGSPTCPVY